MAELNENITSIGCKEKDHTCAGAGSSEIHQFETVYVKSKVKTEQKSSLRDEDSDSEIKEELDKDDPDSEEDEHIEENLSKHELTSILSFKNKNENCGEYQSVFVKSYTSVILKEEPIENVKSIFKESPLQFEKQKYHQEIFEQILERCNNIKLRDLQAQYVAKLREAASIEIFTCSLCDYQTINKRNLNCHFVMNHNGKTEHEIFKCNKCDYEINFRSYIIRHAISHKKAKSKTEKKEKHPCSQCSYTARTEDALQKHLSSHKDKSKCDLCQFQSEDKQVLKEHKNTHKIGPYFKCYKCEYKNGNKLTLALHLLKKHEVESEATKRSKICEICSFAAIDRNKLRLHYITHKSVEDLQEDEIFKCPEPGCNHQTKLKAHLMVHKKIHLPPQFICDVCGFGTRKKQSYADHMTTHQRLSEIKWIHCSICPYKCRTKTLLNQHIKKGIHGDKFLRHIRNRDRIREAEEEGVPVKVKKRGNRTVKVLVGEEALLDEKKVGNSSKSKRKKKPRVRATLNTERILEIENNALKTQDEAVQSR